MNTSKLTSAIATLSLVLFMSIASTANSSIFYSGNLTESAHRNFSVTNTTEKDFSYLRFDVNKYVNENETAEVTHSTFDFLRFDIADFITETDAAAMELPAANEFEYLRFDVNNFAGSSDIESIIGVPANEFDYLRFDVSKFTNASSNAIDELPVTE